MQPQNQPVAEQNRIHSLDVLRGFALLGILVMNIQTFAMVDQAYMNPTSFGDLSGANFLVWFMCHLLADTKFISLFSMLFGAGILLFSQRQEQKNASPTAMHYRRMLWLLLFGLCHAYLIWPGDILVPYAICGSIVFLMRNWKPRTQLVCGLLTISVASLIYVLGQAGLPYLSEPEMQEFLNE